MSDSLIVIETIDIDFHLIYLLLIMILIHLIKMDPLYKDVSYYYNNNENSYLFLVYLSVEIAVLNYAIVTLL